MQRNVILFILLIISVIAPPALGAELAISFSTLAPRQGSVALVTFYGERPARATFGGEPVSIFEYLGRPRALLVIPANSPPGGYNFRAVNMTGEETKITLRVRRRIVPVVFLAVPPAVAPTPEALTKKLALQKKFIDDMVKLSPPEPLFTTSFGLPLRDNTHLTSAYGEIRKTGATSIRHVGVDLSAPRGTAVGAMNDGIVLQTYENAIYGKTIILDHGADISTLYMHLNDIYVSEGESVRRGQLIGAVGKTGYATSPHLHLSVKVNGVSVDPLELVRLF